jgi:hypothetical protein
MSLIAEDNDHVRRMGLSLAAAIPIPFMSAEAEPSAPPTARTTRDEK